MIFFAIVAVAILGFLREFVFVNINEQLFALWYDEPSRATDLIPFLKSVDYYTLYTSKWMLTLVFSFSFYLASCGLLKLIFSKFYWRENAVIFIGLFLLAAVIMTIGWSLNATDKAYTYARFLMGIAQSPLVLMFMIPAIWLRNASGNTHFN